jgi:hypothetical protein
MLLRVEALRYRSLHHVDQALSRFHTLVGPNGSGKSNFLDVVAFIGDLLRVGPRKAMLGDAGSIAPRTADPLHLCWMRSGGTFELALDLAVPAARQRSNGNGKHERIRYELQLEVAPGEVRIANETLWLQPLPKPTEPQQRELFPSLVTAPANIVRLPNKHAPKGWKKVVFKNRESGIDYFSAEVSRFTGPFRLGPDRSALANLPEDEENFPAATWAKRFLMEGVRRVALNAEAMRLPSPPGSSTRFLPDGSNLPWVVQALSESNPEQFRRWIEHVRTAIADFRGVTVAERPEDRHRYLVVEYANGLKAPSWLVSDGTLRLFALTLLAYVPDVDGIYLIEEPENGIHPRAVETVFRSLSSVYGAQVLCASHSPVVLGLARPDDLLCFAKGADGATDIVSGSQHPRLRGWKGSLDLGTLFAAGVLG